MRHAATVIGLACDDLIAECQNRLVSLFDCPSNEIEFLDGVFIARSTNHQFKFSDVAVRTVDSHGPLKVVRRMKCIHRSTQMGRPSAGLR